ncbi:tripartite motif containing 35-28 [Melanotaenia boesemani]|uniref:tripartite motif containing 35-28 n=1 Tax=Melanotaenia boesemani TaxID=1250792 RepID=UPI001C059943|nr:tripartite motif containing 35-28 [Melanotaenia boesemani]
MDVDMSEDEPLPFQQDLTCPVCADIFNDPVLMPCSHSFCRECLQKSLAQSVSKTCPVCREPVEEEQAITNRSLRDTCESFQKQRNLRINPKPPLENLCHLHLKPLELFCEKDEEPVCVDCVTLHNTHRLWSIKDGVPFCKEQLNFKLQIFEKKLEKYKKIKRQFSDSVDYVKYQAGQAEKQIKAEFERLHQVLYSDESLRLKALAIEEEEKIAAIEENISQIDKDIASMKKLVDSLKKEMGNEDLPLLKNFHDLKTKAQWTQSDPGLSFGSLLNMGHHVGSLSFKVWKDMQAHVKYYPVTFNPNTASPWVCLSPDLISVKESKERLNCPDNAERFDPCVFILGAEGYTAGRHKWDIDVGDNDKWIVGVCKESVARKKKFTVSTNRGVWAIGLSKGVYTVLTPDRTELKLQKRPQKIRIRLNLDAGEVAFWDAGAAVHLVSLKHKFDEKMFPIFGPGLHSTPMVLCPGKIAVHTSCV